jgi:hypothetical protein
MVSAVKFNCDISTSDSTVPLGLEIWLNDQQIFNQDWVTDPITFCHNLYDDKESAQELRFLLKNKKSNHTQIDQSGKIIHDACLSLSSLSFDKINLAQIFVEHAIYSHDFNGAGPAVQEKFYGLMGCNGAVTFKFNTPIYTWLLENM